MQDAILYKLPNGKYLSHDPNSVFLIPSENGRIQFIQDGMTTIEFRVKTSLITYQLNAANKVIGAVATMELERADEDQGSTGNV